MNPEHSPDARGRAATAGTKQLDVAVTDSVAANGGIGFEARSAAGHSVTNLALTRTTSSGNSTGVTVLAPNATVRIA